MDTTAAEPTVASDLWTQFQRLGDEGYDRARCAEIAALAAEIRELKGIRKAVVLAHNYQRPEIFEVADCAHVVAEGRLSQRLTIADYQHVEHLATEIARLEQSLNARTAA